MRQKYSQTSTGIATENIIFDRENGKRIVIQYPSFDLSMSDCSVSFKTDLPLPSQNKLIMLLKCLVYLQSLPEFALEEATDKIQEIAHFYSDRLSQTNLPSISPSSIKGKLRSIQVRPPIVLEP
ncbi:hypothetical protein C7H19_11660 [Aphanothece hegewaldii CCALA 016]|uniref:Uncharacterized protein n=1 Tax=Aphanothece hegewaldii CCALA 016 TaxID=2107694 RepID=A0A2T1LXI6_9CHRO|nr:hypothetical protein [Aphanothece hegewaldii]PSF37089.1 hypothetical protein C7H19_11660 [Aphanothece hegewaldii CCALA 016]